MLKLSAREEETVSINIKNLNGRSRAFAGIFVAIVGMFFISATMSMKNSIAQVQELIPEEAEWYEAPVVEIVSVEQDSERKKTNGKYKNYTVYDCEFIVEYEVNGETYQSEQSFNNQSKPIEEGDLFYVKIIETNPERVYVLSTSNSDELRDNSFLNSFAIVGGFTVLVGVIIIISSFISGKKQSQDGN